MGVGMGRAVTGYDLGIDLDDATVAATVVEAEPMLGMVVVLHGAGEPERSFFLYEHLAEVLPTVGWGVVRFDRRPGAEGALERQAADAATVAAAIRSHMGNERLPVALWGFSQGAWAALLAKPLIQDVRFLVLVGFCAVTPGEQMRFATAHYLRSAGYDAAAIRQLFVLRDAWERFYRGGLPAFEAQRVVDIYREEAWFDLAYVPGDLPASTEIEDPAFFDFDPIPLLRQADVPVLIFYGDEDSEVPVDISVAAVSHGSTGQTTIRRLPHAGHDLTREAPASGDRLDPRYQSELIKWTRGQTAPSDRQSNRS